MRTLEWVLIQYDWCLIRRCHGDKKIPQEPIGVWERGRGPTKGMKILRVCRDGIGVQWK